MITHQEREEHPDGHLLSDEDLHEERRLSYDVRLADGATVIDKLRQIVADHAMMDVDGQIVDVQSANVVITIYDALQKEESRQKLASYPVLKMIRTAFRVLDRVRQ